MIIKSDYRIASLVDGLGLLLLENNRRALFEVVSGFLNPGD